MMTENKKQPQDFEEFLNLIRTLCVQIQSSIDKIETDIHHNENWNALIFVEMFSIRSKAQLAFIATDVLFEGQDLHNEKTHLTSNGVERYHE